MRFCKIHWNALKIEIDSQGLSHLICTRGIEALQKTVKMEVPEKKADIEPLMAAHNMIIGNALSFCDHNRIDPTPLMFDDPERGNGCPICFLNWVSKDHVANCKNPECKWPKDKTFDDWVQRAGKEVKEIVDTLPE